MIVEIISSYLLFVVYTGLMAITDLLDLEIVSSIIAGIMFTLSSLNLYIMIKGIIKIFKRENFSVSQLVLFILSFVVFVGVHDFVLWAMKVAHI